jgi:phosphopantothenoylcysteine synthetase/decarboxylase
MIGTTSIDALPMSHEQSGPVQQQQQQQQPMQQQQQQQENIKLEMDHNKFQQQRDNDPAINQQNLNQLDDGLQLQDFAKQLP